MALNPFLSSGLRKSMLDGNAGWESLFDGGELRIYDDGGSQPATADASEQDTPTPVLLATIDIPAATEEVLNGDMSVGGSWTQGSGWAIAAGVAAATASTADLDQTPAIPLVNGYEYEITFTISNYTSGGVSPIVGSTVGTERTANGTYTETIVAAAGATFGIRATTSATLDVDDVSVVIHAFQKFATLGSIAKNGDWKELSSVASGDVQWFRLYDSAVTTGVSTTAIRMDGTVGNGTFDLSISGTAIVATDPVTVDTFTYDLLASDSV